MAIGLSLAATAQPHTVVTDNYSQLQLRLTAATPHIGTTVVDGMTYSTLELDGYMPSAEAGLPSLPTLAGMIEVPFCEGYEVEVTEAEYDTLPPLPYPLMPAQPSRSKSDTAWRPLAIDAKCYATDALIGGGVRVGTAGIARDRRLAHLEYCPVQYNPVSGLLVVCRSAMVTIRYRGADIAATKEHFRRYHSPAFSAGPSLNSLYPKSVASTAPLRY